MPKARALTKSIQNLTLPRQVDLMVHLRWRR